MTTRFSSTSTPRRPSIKAGGRLFLLGALFAAAPLAADEPPPKYKLSLRQEIIAAAKLKNPTAGTFEENIELRFYKTGVALELPPVMLKKTRGFLGQTIEYELLHGDYEGWDSSVQPTQITNLHSVGYGLMAMQPLSPLWRLTGLAKVALASEMRKVTREDLTVQGGLLIGRPFGKWSVSAGVMYANNFGTPLWLPGALIGYESSGKKARFEAQLPQRVEYWHAAGAKAEWGLSARVEGNQYHIDQDGVYRDKTLEYSTGYVGPAVRWKRARAALRVDGGTTFYRRFRFRDGDETMRSFKFKNAPFLQAGLEVSFP